MAWDTLRAAGDEIERNMRTALVQFARGTAPRPDQLLAELVASRRNCETAVRALMDAIGATRAVDPARLGGRPCVGEAAANEDGPWPLGRK